MSLISRWPLCVDVDLVAYNCRRVPTGALGLQLQIHKYIQLIVSLDSLICGVFSVAE